MAFVIKDRVRETTTTTGTSAISLGGTSTSFEAFSDHMSNADTTHYAIVHSTADEWEVGLGTWNTGNTLTRTTVLSSSNSNAAVSFTSGSKDVFMTYPASQSVSNLPLSGGAITGNVTWGDNDKAIFGAGSDLQIYHDGNNRLVTSGDLLVNITDGDEFQILGSSTAVLRATATGSVRLFHNGAEKLTTTSTGIDVTGTVTSNDVNITDTTPNLKFTDTDGNHLANITQSGSHLYIDNDSTGNIRMRVDGNTERLTVNSTGVNVTGNVAVSGTVDGVDIASRDGILTSTTTTANAALPKAGGTLTGDLDFGDDIKAKFGDSDDLQVFHSAGNSFVQDAGAGDLFIAGSNAVRITNSSASETYATFNLDGSVNLYHDNTLRFQTSSTGISVAGNVFVTGTVDGRDIATNIPSSLGTSGQVLTVNSGATATEWADASGGGGGITTGKAIAMAMVFG